ncbi:MAG: VOC family protein [Smithellaceae bacterium]|nr:VOC family protein [Smithellaceae bacterium]NLX51190.1 VOC family protein [Deltaproteobacteria bacterium]
MNHVHHVHLFASDIEKSLAFYRDVFGGQVVLDENMAGARNVFMRVGTGRIHFYDQAPGFSGRGSIHHLGIQTDDIDGIVKKLKATKVPLKKDITDIGVWKYIMVPAPDNVLIELFAVDKNAIPEPMRDYFD